MGEAFLLNIINRGNDKRFPDQVLNAPTNEAWIDPWVAYLKSKNVKFELGAEVQSLTVKDRTIGSAVIKTQSGETQNVEADWFILAFAPEQVAKFLTPDILNLDPNLNKIKELVVDWMTGIQFFLKSDTTIGAGHIGFIESPWRLTAIQQNQFWKKKVAQTYGDGNVKDILSVDISDWETPGMKIKKPAKQCSPEEVAQEAWHQITVTQSGEPQFDRLGDKDLAAWFLDPAIHWDGGSGTSTNDDPLMMNTAGSWDNRPTAKTAIPNLFLAGDYTRNNGTDRARTADDRTERPAQTGDRTVARARVVLDATRGRRARLGRSRSQGLSPRSACRVRHRQADPGGLVANCGSIDFSRHWFDVQHFDAKKHDMYRRCMARSYDELDGQILDAALNRILQVGIRRATLDDIAKRSGINRVTIYRRFSGKDNVVDAVLSREIARILGEATTIAAAAPNVDAQIEETVVYILGLTRTHPLVTQLIAVAPEEALGFYTVRGAEMVSQGIRYIVQVLEAAQERGAIDRYDPRPVAELVARLAHSVMLTPQAGIDFDDPDAVRAFVRAAIVPLMKHGFTTPSDIGSGTRSRAKKPARAPKAPVR